MQATVFLWFAANVITVSLAQKWGTVFGGLESNYVHAHSECAVNGHAMCCGIINYTDFNIDERRQSLKYAHKKHCTSSKTYIASNYEKRHYEKIKEIELESDFRKRRDLLVTFMTSKEEVEFANKWLNRIDVHMNSDVVEATPDDFEFLSRFEITVQCPGQTIPHVVQDWIEPLSIHFRHPFAFEDLDAFNHTLKLPYNFKDIYSKLEITKRVGLMNNDYVLVQSNSGKSIEYHVGNRSTNHHRSPKSFMLDAGASRWDSSSFWFACGYLQRSLYFDQFFGWEMTLLEPTDFWASVPSSIKPLYNFHNIPITSDENDVDCPLGLIKRIVSPNDFVAFKLDVDNQDIEIPIAMRLMQDPALSSLVDEFFFELHFENEFLQPADEWSSTTKVVAGLKLDRLHSYELFLTMRQNGIRAHFWP